MPIDRPEFEHTIAESGIEDGSSQHATLGLGQVECTRKLLCSWSESAKAAQHFLGWSRIVGGKLERLLPASHPDDPALVATRLTITSNHRYVGSRGANPLVPGGRTNMAADGTIQAAYQGCFVDVFYERPNYDLLEDADVAAGEEGGVAEEWKRYVDYGEPEPTVDLFTMPGHALRLTLAPGQSNPFPPPNTTKPISYNVPKALAGMLLKVTWKRLPADFYRFWTPGPWLVRLMGQPFASTPKDPYLNTVNKTAFGPFPAGTLRLDAVKPIRRPAPFVLYTPPAGGAVATWISPAVEWDVEFHFRYAPSGHNFLWNNHVTNPGLPNYSAFHYASASGVYHAPGSVPRNDSLFNEVEFRDLFVVGDLPATP